MKRAVSRRGFLITGTQALVSVVGVLAACAPQSPTPAATPASAKPSSPGTQGAQVTAIASQVTAAPTQVAAPTTAPVAASRAQPTAATRPGAALVGKLEGPEILTDPARVPTALREAPQLAELVKAGTLPPVKDRIGDDPIVVRPVHETGKYGGTWRRGFTGPADIYNGTRSASGPDQPLVLDYTGTKVMPNIIRAYDVGDDGRTFTLRLRRGMKWSDGTPFTADAFMFWYEDVYGNKDLVPLQSVLTTVNGKPGTLTKLDEATVRWTFPDPYYMFPQFLANQSPISSPAVSGGTGMGGYLPGHYLKQFHPKYVGQDELDRKTKEAGFDNWVNLFKNRASWHVNPDLPVVSPWKTVSPANSSSWVLERNPYSIWVDTDGNQLPYIDRVQLNLGENLEVLNLRAIAGEFDFQGRHIDLQKLPVLLDNQQKGGYKVYFDPADWGADAALFFNQSFDADPELAKWIGNADFRRALALGIERDQLNETFWLGTGIPGSAVPADGNPYNPGPEWRTKWAVHDPKQANELLDKIGLAQKDSEGYRVRTDGTGRLRIEIQTLGGQFLPFTQICEMVREQWKAIGIQANVQEVERSLGQRRNDNNEVHITVWSNDGTESPFVGPGFLFPYSTGNPVTLGPLYARWFQTNGREGKEPPAGVREVMGKWTLGMGAPDEERIRLGKEIWQTVADEVYMIGLVGQSPAVGGVRVVKTNVGNVPERQMNTGGQKCPLNSIPQTFYFKS